MEFKVSYRIGLEEPNADILLTYRTEATHAESAIALVSDAMEEDTRVLVGFYNEDLVQRVTVTRI